MAQIKRTSHLDWQDKIKLQYRKICKLSQRSKICWQDKEINQDNQLMQNREANHAKDSRYANHTRTKPAKSRRLDKKFTIHIYYMDMDQSIA